MKNEISKTERKGTAWLLVPLLLLFALSPLHAMEVAGVKLPDSVTISGTDPELILNGAGIRKKLFFKIYVGALYLTRTTSSAEQAITSNGPKRVVMHFLHDEVPVKKLNAAWWDGFESNHSEQQLIQLKTRIEQFTTLFRDTRKGDVYWLDFLPDSGTRVSFNGNEIGIIPGADFNQALLRIWLGKEPVTKALKEGMLGID